MAQEASDAAGILRQLASQPLYINALLVTVTAAVVVWLCRGHARSPHEPKASQLMPAYVPLEIGLSTILLQCRGLASYLPFALRRRTGSLFGITRRHQILYNLPGVDKLFAAGHRSLDTNPLGLSMVLRVFGGLVPPELRPRFPALCKKLSAPVEKGFVNDEAATAALARADVPGKVGAMLSFSEEPAEQRRWERAAKVSVVTRPDPAAGHAGAVELDLENLLRDLGACISIPQLYGQDFLDRNATLLDDFWKFDNHAFPLLVAGAPKWIPIKSFKEGVAARRRLHIALGGFFRRLNQFINDEPVDFDADMSDVSTVAKERNAAFSDFDIPIENRGRLETGTFWGQNANTQPLVFWFILYVYATPGLLDELRNEVQPHLMVSRDAAAPPQITSVDLPALGRDCPLLKSAMFETFRMVNEPTSIRYIARALLVPDGKHQHQLEAGTWISVPHAGIQREPSIFPEPDKFIPDRFLEVDERSGKPVARYGRLRPWGAGVGICKGRTFAEKEILLIAACFITLWDMEPPGGGPWQVPGSVPGTGVARPNRAVRAVLKRRLSW
ncbi:hypothetical protein JDV02_000065 [Purpureocillium takamizusanense]|uniref:Cytochrome P450 n=1 Tax=Purpureocillium takamizusanense TaxID=2060973 RepID=A0A9Q8V555_9HYPO|nr:uncharacterized protein JDV02_000065 [Purpureocillium takamizusanense]UNI13308.1 hypothetical protein JDV02_000065 [Purpureocillium takamizusanense]